MLSYKFIVEIFDIFYAKIIDLLSSKKASTVQKL